MYASRLYSIHSHKQSTIMMKLLILCGLLLVATVLCKKHERQAIVEGCPIDFVKFDSSCYHVFDAPLLKWWEAMAFCAMYSNGEGTLATVESDAEEAFLESQLKQDTTHHGDFWLGATDMVNEGTYVWTRRNEYVSEYTNWAPGQPSSGRAENCLALYEGVQFKWNDAPCDIQASFICEVPYDPSATVIG
ncbi:C-Type lectin [Mactra antiquata]